MGYWCTYYFPIRYVISGGTARLAYSCNVDINEINQHILYPF